MGAYFYDRVVDSFTNPFHIAPFATTANLPAIPNVGGVEAKEAAWTVLIEKAGTIGIDLPRSAEEIQDSVLGQDSLFRNYVNLKKYVKQIQVMLEKMGFKFS